MSLLAGMTANSLLSQYSAEAQAYFAQMTAQPDNARKTLLDDLIKGLKTDGVWDRFIYLYLYAQHSLDAGCIDMKLPSRSKLSPSVTFTTDRGWAGTGSVVSMPNITFTMSDVSIIGWRQSYVSTGTYMHMLGTTTNVPTATIFYQNSNSTETDLNEAYTNPAAATTGLTAVSTTSSGYTMYNNGSAVTTYNGSYPADVKTSNTQAFYAPQYSNYQNASTMALLSFAKSMTSSQHSAMFNRFRTYLQAIGAGAIS